MEKLNSSVVLLLSQLMYM